MTNAIAHTVCIKTAVDAWSGLVAIGPCIEYRRKAVGSVFMVGCGTKSNFRLPQPL